MMMDVDLHFEQFPMFRTSSEPATETWGGEGRGGGRRGATTSFCLTRKAMCLVLSGYFIHYNEPESWKLTTNTRLCRNNS